MMLTEQQLYTIGISLLCWLLTYALHSTVFLATTWGMTTWSVSRRWFDRRPWLTDAVWKGALIGGLLTTSLQLTIQGEPMIGFWPAPSTLSGTSVATPVSSTSTDWTAPHQTASPLPSALLPIDLAQLILNSGATTWVLLIWMLSVIVSWTALGRQSWWHWRRLADRAELLQGKLPAMLAELCQQSGYPRPVRLSTSSRLAVPIALGLRRPEICLPPRTLTKLSVEEQRALLSHELAHLIRRDPLWQLSALVVSGLFPFQPLNRLASLRLRRVSEVLADDWAVRRTDNAGGLARCLTEVAGWAIETPRFFPSPGIAGQHSELGERIQRLLSERIPGKIQVSRRGFIFATSGAVLLVATIAPGWNAPSLAQAAPTAPTILDNHAEASSDELDAPLPDAILLDVTRPDATLPVPLPKPIKPPAGQPGPQTPRMPVPEIPRQPAPAPEAPDEPPVPTLAPEEPKAAEAAPSEPDEPAAPSEPEPPTEASDEPAPTIESPSEPEEPEATSEPITTSGAPAEPTPQPTQRPNPGVEPESHSLPSAAAVPSGAPTTAATLPPAIKPPVLLESPTPRYPSIARRLNKRRATVELQVTVNARGHVTHVTRTGPELGYGFEAEAFRVARGSKFQPATRDGVPMEFTTKIKVGFHNWRGSQRLRQ